MWSMCGFCVRNSNYGLGYILHIVYLGIWAVRALCAMLKLDETLRVLLAALQPTV